MKTNHSSIISSNFKNYKTMLKLKSQQNQRRDLYSSKNPSTRPKHYWKDSKACL